MEQLGRGVLRAACLAVAWTGCAAAQETPLVASPSRQISLMAEGAPWCRPAVTLRLELDPLRPELRRPLALSALMGKLRGAVTRACPQAAFASVQVTSAGRVAANLSASAAGAWIFTTGRPIAAPPALAFGTQAAPNAGANWAFPSRTPALRPPTGPGHAQPQWVSPATPPSAAVAPPSFARALSAPPPPYVPPAVASSLPTAPLSVRLANAIAPAGSPFPSAARRLDNLRDARADALISGQPKPVSLLIQAGGNGRDQIDASWPGSLTLSVPPTQPPLASGTWYLVRGALSAADTPMEGPPPAARLRVQYLIACARPRCEDVAGPTTIPPRPQQAAP